MNLYALPEDMPGYFGSEWDHVDPLDYCRDCGEVLTGATCTNCEEHRADEAQRVGAAA